MLGVMLDCGKVLEDFLTSSFEKHDVDAFDFKDLMSRWTTSITSSIAFGVDADCFNDRDQIFHKMATKYFKNNWRLSLTTFLYFFMPKAIDILKLKIVRPETENYFISILKENEKYRQENNVQRNDCFQMLMQLRSQGFVSVDKEDSEKTVKKISLMEMAAQAFGFFLAGSFEEFKK